MHGNQIRRTETEGHSRHFCSFELCTDRERSNPRLYMLGYKQPKLSLIPATQRDERPCHLLCILVVYLENYTLAVMYTKEIQIKIYGTATMGIFIYNAYQ